MENKIINDIQESVAIMNPEALLAHWQGHRQLTRRVIVSFPEDKLFGYAIAGMRTFSAMVAELLAIEAPGVKGIVTGQWEPLQEDLSKADTKEKLLQLWDQATEEINLYWPEITLQRFQEEVKAFGQYENAVIDTILYFIDNEIHHRGQGYVYLRSLGIEPPAFWDR